MVHVPPIGGDGAAHCSLSRKPVNDNIAASGSCKDEWGGGNALENGPIQVSHG